MQPRKKRNREPEKSTGRDGVLTNSEQDTHLEKKEKRKKIFRFRNNRISSLSSSGVILSASSPGVGI
jgi:hypothetical protein